MWLTKRLTGTIVKSRIFLLIGCIAAGWLGAMPFIQDPWLQLILALPSGCLLCRSLIIWLNSRHLVFSREQFRWLLEHLLARLTAGASLERAFMEAAANLGQLLGKKSDLLLGLQQLEQRLAARQPLDLSLVQLGQKLPCPEANICFQILPALRQAGGQISQYIRQQLRTTTEQLSLQQDIQAENAQRQTEAMILAIMPFGLAVLFQKSSDSLAQEALTTPIGTAGALLAYGLAMIAAVLTIETLAGQNRRQKKPFRFPQKSKWPDRLTKCPARLLTGLYQNKLPETYGVRLLQLLQELSQSQNQNSQTVWQIYFERKTAYLLVCLVPGLLLIQASLSYWYLLPAIPILLSLMQDQQIFRQARQRQMDYRLDYPVFLNLAAALMQAGLSLHIALKACIETLVPGKTGRPEKLVSTALQQDLVSIKNQLQIGVPADQIMEKLAASCVLPEAQAAMLLMIRYDRAGGSEILQLLQMQASTCWSVYRSALRKRLEQESMRLLLSMTLDLLAVMVTAIIPAVLSLQAI